MQRLWGFGSQQSPLWGLTGTMHGATTHMQHTIRKPRVRYACWVEARNALYAALSTPKGLEGPSPKMCNGRRFTSIFFLPPKIECAKPSSTAPSCVFLFLFLFVCVPPPSFFWPSCLAHPQGHGHRPPETSPPQGQRRWWLSPRLAPSLLSGGVESKRLSTCCVCLLVAPWAHGSPK